jgi:hypothetical protein
LVLLPGFRFDCFKPVRLPADKKVVGVFVRFSCAASMMMFLPIFRQRLLFISFV